jgi:hypothetical protein
VQRDLLARVLGLTVVTSMLNGLYFLADASPDLADVGQFGIA